MRNYILFFLLFLSVRSGAQLVGTNLYLQGAYLEIGMNNNGSFGACNNATYGLIPPGYHPHLPGTGALAEVYDYGHDGWAVGSPPFMGDYTYPGSPFEGWAIQVNGTRGQCYQTCPGNVTFGAGWLAGSNTGYSNTGGRAIGIWTGSAATGALQIKMETRVDTLASWVNVTVVMKNTSASALPGVYYWRSCDPDNDQSWPGGAFSTTNTIVYQNDIQHRVLVKAQGQLGPMAWLGLGTKDCRARCCVYSSWGLSSAVDLATVWNGTYATGTTLYTAGTSNTGDVGIGLVYNIGTIASGDSALISYAYMFTNNSGIDSAFPEPQLSVGPVTYPPVASPTPEYDTFNTCLFPGVNTFPIDVHYGDDKSWSWSHWTWSPAIGLASTTGVHNTIDVTVLPGTTTYTITGTDSASGMLSCNNKTFYLTVVPCNLAWNNSPCYGDTLKWGMRGDSLGATYIWYGPMPSTTVFSTLQNPFKFPAVYSDSGLYYVVRTIGSVHDTDSTRVIIHEKPVLIASSNIPLCAPVAANLNLSVSPFLAGGSYSWTGPLSFSSTLQNPVISPFVMADTGTYTVTAVSSFGCKDTATTYVYPGTTAGFTFEINRGCDADTVMVNNTSTNGLTYTWNFDDGSAPVLATGAPASLVHEYTVHKIYNVSITSQNAHCTDTHSEVIDTRHTATAEFQANNDTICVNGESTSLVDLSTAQVGIPNGTLSPGVITSWDWNFGDGSAHETIAGPTHSYTAAGIYDVALTVTDSIGCPYIVHHPVVAIDPVLNGLTDTTFCLTQPVQLNVSVEMRPNIPFSNYTYEWSPATGLSTTTSKNPFFTTGFGDFTYTVTAIAQPYIACPMTHTVTVHSVEGAKLLNVTSNTTIKYGESIQLYSSNEVKYMWTPHDGSLTNNNINNPVATPTVTTTYTVYGMDGYGCLDSATVTVVVDSTMSEFVPSGFTPNGDGLNDVFRPTYLKHQKLVEFSVYNRWGQRVFNTSNKDEGWDGSFSREPQDMGVYFYTIIISRAGYSSNQIYKGEVTLIR